VRAGIDFPHIVLGSPIILGKSPGLVANKIYENVSLVARAGAYHAERVLRCEAKLDEGEGHSPPMVHILVDSQQAVGDLPDTIRGNRKLKLLVHMVNRPVEAQMRLHDEIRIALGSLNEVAEFGQQPDKCQKVTDPCGRERCPADTDILAQTVKKGFIRLGMVPGM
jgi:hypothetical protein